MALLSVRSARRNGSQGLAESGVAAWLSTPSAGSVAPRRQLIARPRWRIVRLVAAGRMPAQIRWDRPSWLPPARSIGRRCIRERDGRREQVSRYRSVSERYSPRRLLVQHPSDNSETFDMSRSRVDSANVRRPCGPRNLFGLPASRRSGSTPGSTGGAGDRHGATGAQQEKPDDQDQDVHTGQDEVAPADRIIDKGGDAAGTIDTDGGPDTDGGQDRPGHCGGPWRPPVQQHRHEQT